MRRNLGLLPLALLVLPMAAIACTVSANVGDLGGGGIVDAAGDVPESSDAGPSDGHVDPAPEHDGGADADPTPIDAGCGVAFAQRGSFVDVGIIQGPPPLLNGGTIAAGLYALTAMRVYYDGSQSGTMQVRETLRVRGSTTAGTFDRLTEARNASGSFVAHPLHGETITFQTAAGPTIFVKPECPKPDFETGDRFDVQGDTLILFDESTWTERVYRRVE